MKYLMLLVFLTSCSKTYIVGTYYGDKELFGCAEISTGSIGSDFLFIDKDVTKVNAFCESLRNKK